MDPILAETFGELLRDPAHWLFELTTDVVFGGLGFIFVGLLWNKVLWPRVAAHFHRDLEHAGHNHGLHQEHAEELPCGIEWSSGVYCLRPYGHPGEHYYASGELEHSWRHGTKAAP